MHRVIKKSLFGLAIGALLLSLTSSLAIAPSAQAAKQPKPHQLIPMYIYPFWWQQGNDWYRVCDSMNASGNGSTAIMNPANGPGPSYNSDYDYVIDHCHKTGNNVIGYVDTSYGVVPIATVKAEIDSYYNWYNTNNGVIDTRIDGIFLDQMSNDASTAPYYHEIFEHIKAKNTTHDEVVGNPGAPATTDWQLNDTKGTQAADEIVIFEGPMTGQYGLDSFVKPRWANNYPASDIGMMVYGVQQADIAAVCGVLKANRAGLVDVTDATITPTSTPWNFLQNPTHWASFKSSC